MNLTFHQFRKDWARLRFSVALWLLLVLLQAALIIPGIAEPGEDLTLQILFKVLNNLIPILQMILPIVIVPLLLHEEPLVGTTAFWFTRPIDGMMLFRSKMLFLGAVLVLPPFLTELVILGVHGASAQEVFLAVPEIALEQLNFLAYVSVLAALTQTFSRFALVGASLFIAYYVAGFIILVVFSYLDIPWFFRGWGNSALADSRYIASVLAVAGISAMLLFNLYRDRKARRAWFTAGAAMVVSFFIYQFWSWDFLGRGNGKRETAIDAAAVNVTIPADPRGRRVSDTLRYRPKDEAKKEISVPLRLSGLPADYVAEPVRITSSLAFPDGTIIEDKDYLGAFGMSWNSRIVQQALGTARILNPEKEPALHIRVLSVGDHVFEKYAAVPGKLSAEVEFVVKRYSAVAEIPVRPRARYDRGSEHAVITHVLRQTGGSTILLRESRVSLFFRGDRPKEYYFDFFMRPTIYVLRNDTRKEALWPDERPGPEFDLLDIFYQRRLRTFPLALRYTALTDQGHKLTEFNDEWLADASLVRVEARPAGHLTKNFQVDDFVMGTP
jgi:hypothetical protein